MFPVHRLGEAIDRQTHMRRRIDFILGFIAGIMFTFVTALIIEKKTDDSGMTFF